MYANLRAEKAKRRLTDETMAEIIGVHKNTYRNKMVSGKFAPWECKKLCDYFGKSFNFLFALEEEEKHE